MADDNARLVLHRGAKLVSREELDKVEPPEGTASWHPMKHSTCYETVLAALTEAGFAVKRTQFAIANEGHRMFATVDLASELAEGVALAVGVRNSTDKTFPLGFTAGNRVFVCDNLAFRSEIFVKKKHTRNSVRRFTDEIAQAVRTLSAFQRHETQRVLALREREVTDETAESIMLRSFETGIVSYVALPKVIAEWREPSFAEFAPRTAWSLMNAFTTALSPRLKTAPQVYTRITMRLGGLVDAAVGIKPFVAVNHDGGGDHVLNA